MSQRVSKTRTGKTGEASSGVLPGSAHPQQQQSFRFPRLSSVQSVHSATAELQNEMLRNCRESGGLEQLCAEMGRPATYASKLSEALTGVDGKRPSVEVMLAQLLRGDDNAMRMLGMLNEAVGCVPPLRYRVASDAELLDAVLGELDGKMGADVLEKAARRLGTDRGAFRRGR